MDGVPQLEDESNFDLWDQLVGKYESDLAGANRLEGRNRTIYVDNPLIFETLNIALAQIQKRPIALVPSLKRLKGLPIYRYAKNWAFRKASRWEGSNSTGANRLVGGEESHLTGENHLEGEESY